MTTREHSGLSSSPAENKTRSYINENIFFSSIISTKEIVFKGYLASITIKTFNWYAENNMDNMQNMLMLPPQRATGSNFSYHRCIIAIYETTLSLSG